MGRGTGNIAVRRKSHLDQRLKACLLLTLVRARNSEPLSPLHAQSRVGLPGRSEKYPEGMVPGGYQLLRLPSCRWFLLK